MGEALAEARDALARIEQAAQRGDSPPLHELSRAYARFCLHAREYLSGFATGRVYPRRLARSLDETVQTVAAHSALVRDLGLGLDETSLAKLRDEALAAR